MNGAVGGAPVTEDSNVDSIPSLRTEQGLVIRVIRMIFRTLYRSTETNLEMTMTTGTIEGGAMNSAVGEGAPVTEDSNVDSIPLLQTEPSLAVHVKQACKRYGSTNVTALNNLDMTVAKGTIYGLLGASGCGKTTLLSCIVGQRRLNSGEIWVLGGKPGTKGSGVPGKQVGYMPQEIALFGEFSIKETMMYFGWIFGMEIRKIDKRLQSLLKFLDLPNQNRLVKDLSGGQQRRVSLTVALIHKPELLILDEPTVGVDPLLRQTIWTRLRKITRGGNRTVILTTHYIEEARRAHKIGLMREGRLLAEESPRDIRTKYGFKSLEKFFLKLSRRQDVEKYGAEQNDSPAELNASNNTSLAGITVNKNKKKRSKILTPNLGMDCNDCGNCSSFFQNITTVGKMKALLLKNYLKMRRNVGLMLFIFALPVIQVILFCLAVGGDPTGLRIAIVNQEVPNWINAGVCEKLHGCTLENLSCRYLQHLSNRTMIQEPYATVDEALNAVKLGNAWGAMYFTDNFTDAMIARIGLGRDAYDETLDQSEIRVWLDMSNQQIGLMLNRDLQVSYRDFAQDLSTDCKENPKLGDIPIQFKDPIYGKRDPSFTDFAAPGVILTIVFFLAVALTSFALVTERAEGLLDRSLVAGVSIGEVLLSHIITQFVVMCGQTALVLIFMILVFGVECQGNIFYVIVLTILQGLCGMCFGFVISAVCDLERNSIQLALGSFYPTLLLSGVIWPIEGMPLVLRYIALGLPLTMATTSLRSILTRGWAITEPDVYNGFIATFIWIAVFLVATMVILKVKKG